MNVLLTSLSHCLLLSRCLLLCMTKDAGELNLNASNGMHEAAPEAAPDDIVGEAGNKAASVLNRMQSFFPDNDANAISFEEGDVALQPPADGSAETANVEEASSSGSTATANSCCINFKSGQFKMYLCKNAESTHHDCTFALCPDCYDDKNMNSQSGRRATNSTYGRRNKRARTDPKECNHEDVISLKTCDTASYFSASHMEDMGVKMCVECRKSIPPQ